MKFLICQSSFFLGDLDSNKKKILNLAKKDADLIIFPELSLTGYPPEDLLELPYFIKKTHKSIESLRKKISYPAILVGSCFKDKNHLYNSALFIHQHKIKTFHKSSLSTSDTFDEMRFFTPSSLNLKILRYKNKNILILICEDLWKINTRLIQKKIDYTICINASPYFPEQHKNRMILAQKICKKTKAPFIYINQIGGQDEWIFDGFSFVLNEKGEKIIQLPLFKQETHLLDFNKPLKKISLPKKIDIIHQKKQALVLGIKDFTSKNKVKKIHIGLSGGLDSAIVALLCKEVFEEKNIVLFYLPGPYSSNLSRALSYKLAQELNIKWIEKSIIPVYKSLLKKLHPISSLAKQNLQARLRLIFLMSYSNTTSSFLINTSNKSELATGYSTLYGDLTGAVSPLGDLYKTEVQEMAQKCFSSYKVLSQILKKEPSAELSKNQKDSNDLPPYEKLDKILKKLLENKKEPKTVLEKQIFSLILKNEFKRRQAPLILKTSSKSFGRGRRYPITCYNKFNC